MFSSPLSPRLRIALATSAAVLVLAGCSSATSEDTAADVTETSIEEVLEQTTTVQAETDEVDADTTTSTTVDDVAEPGADEATEEVDDPDDDVEEEVAEDTATPTGVNTNIVADATGGRSTFDGEVDEVADLDALVVDAWGDGGLGLHRGHAQVENVLEAFLGIDHDAMHEYMDDGLNLAALSEELGKDPDALVETLTASYSPFVEEGVANGVITEDEADQWIELLRTEFDDRVYWDGVSAG